MIAFIEGRVEARANHALVLNVGGVGFAVQTTSSAVAAAGATARLYTRLIVREDALELFGFPTQEEVAMFDKLTSVTGVGPKMALAVLSSLSMNDLILAIAAEDEKAFTRVSGVGKKTAQRLLLELKDLAAGFGGAVSGASGATPAVNAAHDSPEREALEALMALGYSSAEAGSALMKIRDAHPGDIPPAELIRLALRALSRQG